MPLPCVKSYASRGKCFDYYRRPGFSVRLPDDSASPSFAEAWADAEPRWKALQAPPAVGRDSLARGSVGALMADYKASPEHLGLAPKSQADYARLLDELAPIARFPARDIRRSHLVRLRAGVAKRRGDRSADMFVAVCAALFRCGLDLDYGLEVNPAHDIRRISTPSSFKPWPKAARDAFEAAAAASACPRWVWTGYMIGLWTALRLENVLALSRRQFDGEGWDVTAFKTDDEGWLPACRELRGYLAELPVNGLTYVADAAGRPIPTRRFSGAFRDMLDRIGHPDLQFHGLRVTTATALFEAGASDAEAGAITLHRTRAMVHHYGRRASQKRLAKAAMRKLEGGSGCGTLKTEPALALTRSGIEFFAISTTNWRAPISSQWAGCGFGASHFLPASWCWAC